MNLSRKGQWNGAKSSTVPSGRILLVAIIPARCAGLISGCPSGTIDAPPPFSFFCRATGLEMDVPALCAEAGSSVQHRMEAQPKDNLLFIGSFA
jgi:hypothetical protein